MNITYTPNIKQLPNKARRIDGKLINGEIIQYFRQAQCNIEEIYVDKYHTNVIYAYCPFFRTYCSAATS